MISLEIDWKSPVESLTPMMFGTVAISSSVSCSILVPVRPGMLYAMIGMETAFATLVKCASKPRWGGLL